MARILLITDAWKGQTNGVVTTLENLVKQAKQNGDEIHVYHPGRCRCRFPLPWYREIDVAFPNKTEVDHLVAASKWDHIHVATPEGWVGRAFMKALRKYDVPFSASCHTKFPEFVNHRFPFISIAWGWRWMKRRYKDATKILVPSQSMERELQDWGFDQEIVIWTRGTDRILFHPSESKPENVDKILLCVSRISQEKGLDDFCGLTVPNTRKIVVGDGPYLETLKKKYPLVEFVGKKTGRELAAYYQTADVFVFPSKSDTFGVVMLEAIACGTPVAAYPVTGPRDIIKEGKNGSLYPHLKPAIDRALAVSRYTTYLSSLEWTWENCYDQFKQNLLDR
jgi:glycosyltransferase involved in cell wall biosynthesis